MKMYVKNNISHCRIRQLPTDEESGGWIQINLGLDSLEACVCDDLHDQMCISMTNNYLHVRMRSLEPLVYSWPIIFLMMLNTPRLRAPLQSWLEKRR